MARAGRLASTNDVRPELPLRLDSRNLPRALPAGALSIQSLLPKLSPLQAALQEVVSAYSVQFPDVAVHAFWQPAATFHVNVARLTRLLAQPLAPERCHQLLHQAAPLLDWLDEQPAYRIEFRGLLLGADGTLMAKGYPLSTTPWDIRREFREHGFPDQAVAFHMTLGRILEPLPKPRWKELVRFTAQQAGKALGTFDVQQAILINEREGFLHTPACYHVIRRFQWSPQARR